MKVLHINCNYLTTALHQTMMEHLNKTGVQSTVIAPTYDVGNRVIEPKEYVVPAQCFKKNDRFVFWLKQRKIVGGIDKKVKVKDYDLLHAYTLFTDGNVAYQLSQKYGMPYVVAVRSTDVDVFFKKLFYLRGRGVRILRNASAVFFLSKNHQRIVLERYVPAKYRQEVLGKSYIIPNGIDDFWLENCYIDKLNELEESEKRLAAKKLKVIFAGNLIPRKNPLVTQEALEILRKRGWSVQFTAVGKATDKELCKQMCAYPDTTYIEQQPKERLLEYYRKNDVFVMPSYMETFGLVYSEAMSQGLPVIYTKGQGFDGQFAEGEVGYGVAASSPQDIADKIELSVMNYKILVQNSLRLAERFRWGDICKKYREVYDQIISS